MVKIETEKCARCGGCIDFCPAMAIRMVSDRVTVDADLCIECSRCQEVCPLGAPHESDQ